MYNSPKCPPPCEPCNPCKEPVRREQPTWCGPADCTPVGNVYDIQGMKPIPPCPAPGPGYMIPSMRPEIRNMTESQQVQELTKRVDDLTQAINDYSKNVYGAYNTIVNSALCNDAYYDEIKQQTGYIEANNCYYTLVDIPFVDCANRPIYLELALAYNNTQNMGVTEDILDASYHLVADKMVPASSGPFVENDITTGWDGLVFYGGAPISNPTHQVNWTIATTANGFIKLYPNTTDRTVMQNDRVMDAMGCMSVLVNNGVATPNLYGVDAGQPKARVAIGMNYKTKHRFIVVTDGTDTIGSTSSDLSNIFVNLGCDVAAEVCTGAKAVGLDKGMFMYTPSTKDDNGAPTSPKECAFWFITKCRHYKNQYVRDVAELTQNVGKQTWQATLANLNVSDMWVEVGTLNKKLTQEIADREQGDATLDAKIEQEISDREQADSDISSKLEQEISDRTDADTKLSEDIEAESAAREDKDTELQEAISAEETARKNADTALGQTIAAETAARTEADAVLQEDVDNIKESYLPLAGGTMTGPINMNGQTIDSLPEPSEADHAVNKQYVDNADEKLEDAIEERLPLTGGTMKGAINMNGQSITNLADAANDGDAVSKKYMENALEDYLPTNGGTMNGAINMGDHTITNVADPVSGTDAANKEYTDNAITSAVKNVNDAVASKYLPLAGGSMSENAVVNFSGDESGIVLSGTSEYKTRVYDGGLYIYDDGTYAIVNLSSTGLSVNENSTGNGTGLSYSTRQSILRIKADDYTVGNDGTSIEIWAQADTPSITFSKNNTASTGGYIRGLGLPTSYWDAANKGYVDSLNYFTVQNDSPNAYLILKDTYHSIHVNSEDGLKSGYLSNDQLVIIERDSAESETGNMTVVSPGEISFGTENTGVISGLANPNNANDAANKAYVDAQVASAGNYFNVLEVAGASVLQLKTDYEGMLIGTFGVSTGAGLTLSPSALQISDPKNQNTSLLTVTYNNIGLSAGTSSSESVQILSSAIELTGEDYNASDNGTKLVLTNDNIEFRTHAGVAVGTMTVNENKTGVIFGGLDLPTENNQAANKEYADQQSTKMWSYSNTVVVNAETTDILQLPALSTGNWFVNIFIDFASMGSFSDHYTINLYKNDSIKIGNLINSESTYLESAYASFIAEGGNEYKLVFGSPAITNEYNMIVRIVALNITGHWTNDSTHPY